MKISVIIPSFNRCASVLALLGDLEQQDGGDFELIVVDDASSDGSATAIAAVFPRVRLLVNGTNGGPCVTRNRGIRAARGANIVGLDSDVRISDRSLLQRVTATFDAVPASVQGLAFRLLQPDGVSEDAARWWHPVSIGGYADRTFETSYFSGTGYAFRRPAVMAAGLFPEILYMHYEEVELAWRILDAGGTILHCPDLAVQHHEHQVSRRSEVKTFYRARNQILLAAACLPIPIGAGFLLPRLAFAGFRALRGGHLPSFGRALISAARLLPERVRERRPLARATRQRMARMREGLIFPDLSQSAIA